MSVSRIKVWVVRALCPHSGVYPLDEVSFWCTHSSQVCYFYQIFCKPSMAAHCKMVGYKMGEQWLWTAIYLLTEQRVSGGSADVCNRRSRTSHDYKCRSFAIVVTSKPLELRPPSAPGAIEPLGFVIEEWIWLHGVPPIGAIWGAETNNIWIVLESLSKSTLPESTNPLPYFDLVSSLPVPQ